MIVNYVPNVCADQQQRIVSKLKQFSGAPFVLRVFQEPEAVRLMNQVLEILHSATWVQKPVETATQITTKYVAAGITLDAGVIVRIDTSRASELEPAGRAFVAALADERIPAEFRVTSLPRERESISITIGKKP